ncbi:cache domain-containing protein [Pseudoduganella ginsengisoli]|uniref:Histidine kinase n=1 Tax=Pseudoduganella ginsengisoli TaxID=1462440 RepID=A0A6L6Q2T3_9BURK|nr:cache domain-containing protein [Pseudoduganella ginsengisoli]MTW04183.1 histidine kinase [Pseudoduganella ginsengisoli]
MKNFLAGVMLALASAGAAFAADKGTQDEAVAMVKKAVALIKAKGRDAALAEFNNPKGGFVDRDLYIFVLDKDGVTLANGVNQRLVGKNVMQLKDADGKFFIKNFLELGDTKGKGWAPEYKWSNTVTQAMETKQSYVEKVDNLYVGCGVYK